MNTLYIVQNNKVSHIFIKMIWELIFKYPNLGTMQLDDFKKVLPAYFKTQFNSLLDFETQTVTFNNEVDLTLALIKFD